MIRPAETKDLPAVMSLFMELLDCMAKSGVDVFDTDDRNKYVGGIMAYLVGKLQAPGHAIFVREEDGTVKGMLIGMIEQFPEFYKHRLTAVLEYVYPLTFSSTPLAKAFYAWGKEQGATTVSCIVQFIQNKFLELYERQGFNPQQFIMVRGL